MTLEAMAVGIKKVTTITPVPLFLLLANHFPVILSPSLHLLLSSYPMVGDSDLSSGISLTSDSCRDLDILDDLCSSDNDSWPDPASPPLTVETPCLVQTSPWSFQAGPNLFTTTFTPPPAARLAGTRAVYGSGASEAEILSLCPAHLLLRRNAGQSPLWATRNSHGMRRYQALVGGPRPNLLRDPLPPAPPIPLDHPEGRTPGCPGCAVTSPLLFNGVQWQHCPPPPPKPSASAENPLVGVSPDTSLQLLLSRLFSTPAVSPLVPLADLLGCGGADTPFLTGDAMRFDVSERPQQGYSTACNGGLPTHHRRPRRGCRKPPATSQSQASVTDPSRPQPPLADPSSSPVIRPTIFIKKTLTSVSNLFCDVARPCAAHAAEAYAGAVSEAASRSHLPIRSAPAARLSLLKSYPAIVVLALAARYASFVDPHPAMSSLVLAVVDELFVDHQASRTAVSSTPASTSNYTSLSLSLSPVEAPSVAAARAPAASAAPESSAMPLSSCSTVAASLHMSLSLSTAEPPSVAASAAAAFLSVFSLAPRAHTEPARR
jgi:hypothetical protein